MKQYTVTKDFLLLASRLNTMVTKGMEKLAVNTGSFFPPPVQFFYISPCRKNLPVPGGRSFLSAMPVWVAQFIVWPCKNVVKKITNTAAREVFSSNWHHLGPHEYCHVVLLS